jgi:hypothetical protein
MVSFDAVRSAILVDRAYIRNKLNKDNFGTQNKTFYIDDIIIKLLRFTLSNSFFIITSRLTNKFMVVSCSQFTSSPKKWFRYVDNIFSIIKEHSLINHFL